VTVSDGTVAVTDDFEWEVKERPGKEKDKPEKKDDKGKK
jgi:hypothetical protein